MTLNVLADFFCGCLVVNFSMLFLWFLMIFFAKDMICKMHGAMFGISREEVLKNNYKLFAFFKVLIFIFNLAPWIALKVLGA